MPNPTREERIAEVEAIYRYADHKGGIVLSVQDSKDDYGTDGTVLIDGKKVYVEVRRKGFENHSGKSCDFRDGWDNSFLILDGIYLNIRTINKYDGENPFVYLVEIKDHGWRAATIDQHRIDILLRQRHYYKRSTNSGTKQRVGKVFHCWFTDRLN